MLWNDLRINIWKWTQVNVAFFISGNKFEHLWVNIGNDKTWECGTVEFLGITLDNDLKFDEPLDFNKTLRFK